jgi:hypothetical protein
MPKSQAFLPSQRELQPQREPSQPQRPQRPQLKNSRT